MKRLRRKLKRLFRTGAARRRGMAGALCALAVLLVIAMQSSILNHMHSSRLTYHSGGPAIPWLSPSVAKWNNLIDRSAKRYDLSPDLIAIIITLESGGDPRATSPVEARGLMQVTDPTAHDISLKFLKDPVSTYDIYDPATNIEFGTAYLNYLRREYGDSFKDDDTKLIELLAAGYNGGPGAANILERNQPGRGKENTQYGNNAATLWQNRRAGALPPLER